MNAFLELFMLLEKYVEFKMKMDKLEICSWITTRYYEAYK